MFYKLNALKFMFYWKQLQPRDRAKQNFFLKFDSCQNFTYVYFGGLPSINKPQITERTLIQNVRNFKIFVVDFIELRNK